MEFGHNKTDSIKKREEKASWPCKSKIDMLFLKFHDFIYCLGYVQVREGRNQTLSECLKKEFRLTMNILRTTISEDMYEVIDVVIGRNFFDRRQFNVIIFEFVPY